MKDLFHLCEIGAASREKRGSLPVGVLAVLYGEDADDGSEVVEAGAVVTDAEAELRWLDLLEAFHISFSSGEVAGDRMENAEGCGLVDSAELGLGRVRP